MQYAVDDINRISVRGRAGRFKTPALVDRDIDHDRSALHSGEHAASDEPRRQRAGHLGPRQLPAAASRKTAVSLRGGGEPQLLDALKQVAARKPEDPIEFIGEYMLKQAPEQHK